MSEEIKLNRPWLVAAWPGMGQVALSGGYYLMSKLGMHQYAEFSPRELFEVDHVEVEQGLIRTGRLPRSRLFVWIDPQGKRDILVFLGEAQPPLGKYAFCHKLIEYAQELGVERVVTFAAMATQMHPQHDSRVFAAATDLETLAEVKRLQLELVEDGHIGGLNGLLLGVGAEAGLQGACLLGEMPHMFAQFPFPKASLAVLEAFKALAGVQLDLTELSEQATAMEQKLEEVVAQLHRAVERQAGHPEEEGEEAYAVENPLVSPEDEQRIEQLFSQAEQDRSQAYELKRFLDQLDVFAEYEDRFLDLFSAPE